MSASTGVEFDARVRIDTPNEWRSFRHGGILHFVLRPHGDADDGGRPGPGAGVALEADSEAVAFRRRRERRTVRGE